jgi:hypothetical protein
MSSHVPPPTRRVRSRRELVLAAVLVVTVLLAVLVVRALTGAGPEDARSARVAAWPTAALTSPSTPPGQREWDGALPPPTTPAPSTSGGFVDDEDPAAAPTGEPDTFCTSARSGLASLGSDGVEVLRAMATRTGDALPQARTMVENAVARADELRDTAPAALTDAVGTLGTAWSRLEAELDKEGWTRTEVLTLSLKYLASPAVAAAVEVLDRWTVTHCGTDLLGEQIDDA